MIVLDASVLIGHLDARDPHHAKATALLEASEAEPLGASTITLAETLVAPARAKRLEEAKAALERLGVAELELGEGVPAGSVASFDADLRKTARKLGLEVVGEGAMHTPGRDLSRPGVC